MLDVSALDAFIAGLSTAFFGALVAGGAYLLKQHMHLRERLDAVDARFKSLEDVDRFVRHARAPETLKSAPTNPERDVDGR